LLSAWERLAVRKTVQDENQSGEEEANAGGEKGRDRVDDDADRQERGSPEDINGRVGNETLDGALPMVVLLNIHEGAI
jgi:hypothetical protein